MCGNVQKCADVPEIHHRKLTPKKTFFRSIPTPDLGHSAPVAPSPRRGRWARSRGCWRGGATRGRSAGSAAAGPSAGSAGCASASPCCHLQLRLTILISQTSPSLYSFVQLFFSMFLKLQQNGFVFFSRAAGEWLPFLFFSFFFGHQTNDGFVDLKKSFKMNIHLHNRCRYNQKRVAFAHNVDNFLFCESSRVFW